MGEKLELRLKSPVGAEPAVYPWPLPVYVSAALGPPVARRTWESRLGIRPFPARARWLPLPPVHWQPGGRAHALVLPWNPRLVRQGVPDVVSLRLVSASEGILSRSLPHSPSHWVLFS
jgi:hypothetical protein